MPFSFQGQETKLLSSCCGIFECSISLLRPCPTFASLGHPRSDFLLPRRPCPHTHPRVAAPFLRITSAHVFRRLLLHAAATACERCVRHMALTRVVYPALSKAGRFATASLRSRARSALRNQAQYFSIGLVARFPPQGTLGRTLGAKRTLRRSGRPDTDFSKRPWLGCAIRTSVLPAYLPTCLKPAYTCLPTYLPMCLLAYPPTCLRANVRTCLADHLPT